MKVTIEKEELDMLMQQVNFLQVLIGKIVSEMYASQTNKPNPPQENATIDPANEAPPV